MAFESDQVTHSGYSSLTLLSHFRIQGQNLRRNGIVEQDIHPALVNFGDGVSPNLKSTKVRVENGCIQNSISVRSPRLVQQGGSYNIDTLDIVSMFPCH